MLSTELFLSPHAAKMSIYKSALPVSSFFTLQKEVLPIASPEAASSPYDGQRSVAQPSLGLLGRRFLEKSLAKSPYDGRQSKPFVFQVQGGVTRDT